ncbi:hypothetical protein [Bacteriovorax sp. BAL6_X]|uniref:hypothetical protein n=1 Tax=Bacteriovorax sp. BAL6_X TaxID=1201290 RepID=UPI0012EDAFE9|nr:hypothetical protein [Bacteriovorax sp. BAL6_X]
MIIFIPGLNQAPASFIFSNPNVKFLCLSFNKKMRPNLSNDLKQIRKIFKNNSKSVVIAHSIAALLIEWLIQNENLDIRDNKLIYMAPAFYPPTILAKIVKVSARGVLSHLPVPSLAPPKSRARSYVELSIYREILVLNEGIALSKCTADVIVDQRDEMLNIKYLKGISQLEVVRENQFPHHRCYTSLKRIID